MNEDNTKNQITPENSHPNSITEKVFGMIEEQHIEPSSKLRLRLKNDGFWILWLLSILIGAAAVAGTLFVFTHADYKFYGAIYNTYIDFFFDTLPLLWILVVVIFTLLAFQNIRHTKYGYRYPFGAIIALSIISSLIIGGSFYILGVGQIIDQNVGSAIPLYTPTVINQEEKWNNPEKGVIAGYVTFVAPDFSSFELTGFDGHKWRLGGESLIHIDQLILSEYSEVRVVGVQETFIADPDLFHPCLVLPWMTNGDEHQNTNISERKIIEERNNICRGVRPYELLKGIQ